MSAEQGFSSLKVKAPFLLDLRFEMKTWVQIFAGLFSQSSVLVLSLYLSFPVYQLKVVGQVMFLGPKA